MHHFMEATGERCSMDLINVATVCKARFARRRLQLRAVILGRRVERYIEARRAALLFE